MASASRGPHRTKLDRISEENFKVNTDDAGNPYLLREVSSYERDSSSERNTLFSNIRSTMKVMGSSAMFLYGVPSANVLTLLSRLYNQNMIRILLSKHDPAADPNEFNKKNTLYMRNMMTGVAEVNGRLYIAISEDPREDSKLKDKLRILYTLLRYSNCNVHYDPDEYDDPRLPTGMSLTKQDIFPTNPITMSHTHSLSDLRVRIKFLIQNKDSINKFLLLKNDNLNESYNKLVEQPLDVTIIHSIDYLFIRRAPNSERGTPSLDKAMMYPPFKKSYVSGSDGTYACSNGSTCSESKIFSYLHNKIPNFNVGQIQGYAAYWLGSDFPPFGHGMLNYNYPVTDPKFQDIYAQVMSNMPREIVDAVAKPKLEYFVVPFALPCPGCFANYGHYTKNLKSLVDNSDCYHVNSASKISDARSSRSRQSKQEIDQLNLSTSGPFDSLKSAFKMLSPKFGKSNHGGRLFGNKKRTNRRHTKRTLKKQTRKHKNKYKNRNRNRTNKKQ